MNGTAPRHVRNERGVALLIVLMVTALMIALVFEFAYATRISTRSAVNFRDSQRAYFLARSGVNFAGVYLSDNLKNNRLQDNLEQRDWQVVPIMAGGDTELRLRWEDEGGKINISNVYKENDAYRRLSILFTNRGISQAVLDRISERSRYLLLTELHQVMGDEDFRKIRDFVTVSPVARININTASAEVLQSLGISSGLAERIVERRGREPFKETEINSFLGPENASIAGLLTSTSNVFRVESFATAGGYTKQVEAVITRVPPPAPVVVSYWRAL